MIFFAPFRARGKRRKFWQNLPANIRQEYIAKAKGYLDYNCPTAKANDYLEYIRSGNRQQESYCD